jgi:2-polyprenyl-3-methyl-5-hydroxy-6-metoxy-1,4-benzoquinol methylase
MSEALPEITIPCCVCDSRDAVPWRIAGDNLLGGSQTWHAVRCRRCGTRRLDPRPPADTMSRYYAPETYARAEAADSEIGRRLDTLAAHLADRAARLATAPGEVLDVGCGDGRFLLAMRERGWRITGTETDPVAAGLARSRTGATVLEKPLEEMPLSNASFDLVTLLHVLEHVPDPRETLNACRALLRPGGALFVALPNAGSPEACLFGSAWYHLDLPRHLWGFTPSSLTRLAQEAGFTQLSVRQYPLLFTPQSARTAMRLASRRRSAPGSGAGPDAPGNAAAPARGSGGRTQSRIFYALLGFSERLAAIGAPGEIMEIVGRTPA